MRKIYLVLCLILCCATISQVPLDPKTELVGYYLKFSSLKRGSLEGYTVPTFELGDPIQIEWDAPTTRVKLENQPDPVDLGDIVDVNIEFVSNDSVAYDSTAIHKFCKPLSAGEWQLQIAAVAQRQSKYSQPVGFIINELPPYVPARLRLITK